MRREADPHAWVRRLWFLVLRFCPTAWLDAELAGREGVEASFVEPYASQTFVVEGPASVLVNRD